MAVDALSGLSTRQSQGNSGFDCLYLEICQMSASSSFSSCCSLPTAVAFPCVWPFLDTQTDFFFVNMLLACVLLAFVQESRFPVLSFVCDVFI